MKAAAKSSEFTLTVLYYCFYLLLLIMPFLHFPHLISSYELPKYIFLVAISLIIGVLTLIRQFKNQQIESGIWKITFILWLIILAGDILGLDTQTSIIGQPYRFQGFITITACMISFLSAIHLQKSKIFFRNIFKIVSLVAVFIFLDVIYQLVLITIFQLNIPTINHRIIGPIGNPDALGGFAAIILPLLIYSRSIHKIDRYLRTVAIIFSILTILISQSRGAVLSGSILFMYVIVNSLLSMKYKVTLILSTVIIGVGAVFIFYRSSIWENRVIVWQSGLQAVAKRPLLGYGQENFRLIFPKERKIVVDNAHNIFLEILVSSGVFGLVAYCLLLFMLFHRLPLVGRVFMAIFLLRAQFNPLSIVEILYFWVVVGIFYGTGSKPPLDHG